MEAGVQRETTGLAESFVLSWFKVQRDFHETLKYHEKISTFTVNQINYNP